MVKSWTKKCILMIDVPCAYSSGYEIMTDVIIIFFQGKQ